MPNKAETYKNCLDCPEHEVILDTDPDDWFCDDDQAVICKLTPNTKRDENSRYMAEHSEFRIITLACRPYQLRRETETPSWCPLNKKNKSKKK